MKLSTLKLALEHQAWTRYFVLNCGKKMHPEAGKRCWKKNYSVNKCSKARSVLPIRPVSSVLVPVSAAITPLHPEETYKLPCSNPSTPAAFI